jgi:glycosyltransferase involved in cell wall biosynthesis
MGRDAASEPGTDADITMLVRWIDGGGGIARSVTTLANGLAKRRRVHIVSAERVNQQRAFELSPSVDVSYVAEAPSSPAESIDDSELGSDPRMIERLAAMRSGVLVVHNPRLALQAAQHVGPDVTLIAREHSAYEYRPPDVLSGFRQHADRIDAIVALTEADRQSHARNLEGLPTRVLAIPNALPWKIADKPAAKREPVIVGAGTLVPNKGHRRLIEAFAPVAARHPEWRLHIYGRGREREPLQGLIDDLGLHDRVVLKGFSRRFKSVLDHASVFALASHYEGFGMVLVEAMSRGVPVVSFDCPTGPRHVIADGRDGLLVPDGDIAAMTDALDRLIADSTLREELSTAGLDSARRYEPRALRRRWLRLFDQLAERRRRR